MKIIRVEYNYTVLILGKRFTVLHIDKEKKFVVITYEDGKLERLGYVFLKNELEGGRIILNKKQYSKRELIDALLRYKNNINFNLPYAFEHNTDIGLIRVHIENRDIEIFTFVDSEYVDAIHPLTEDEFKEFDYK
jgi:hypothetical protein